MELMSEVRDAIFLPPTVSKLLDLNLQFMVLLNVYFGLSKEK